MITYDSECSSCWLGHSHTVSEHDLQRTTCRAWTCGREHPKTDHMPMSQAIDWRNSEQLKRVSGAVTTHWGYVAGSEYLARYLFAILPA